MKDKELTFRDLPDYGNHMTMKDFKRCVKSGGFIDYDGYGDLATATQCSNIEICPSDISQKKVKAQKGWGGGRWVIKEKKIKIPKWATHVMWYNR